MPGGQSEGTSSILAKVLESTARDVVRWKPLLVQHDTLDRKMASGLWTAGLCRAHCGSVADILSLCWALPKLLSPVLK